MAHRPDWVLEDGEWLDDNQPDSDQTNGATCGEWVEILAAAGIHPPR